MSKERKEGVEMKDYVKAVLRDKNGKIKAIRETGVDAKDILVNAGLAQMAGLLLTDVSVDAFDFIGIGTGTVTPAVTDTDLGTSVKRKASTGTRVTTSVADDTAQLVTSFSSGDGLSGQQDITEVGVFTAVSGGTMLFRQTFTALSVDWDAGDTLEMTCKVQMKQGS